MTAHSSHGFVLDPDQGEPYWFLNTLTINKIGGAHTLGSLSVVEHRMPAGFAPPPHVHYGLDEAFYVIDGEITGCCGDTTWRAERGSIVFLPRDVPHGFNVSAHAPASALVMVAPAGFDEFVAALGDVPLVTHPSRARRSRPSASRRARCCARHHHPAAALLMRAGRLGIATEAWICVPRWFNRRRLYSHISNGPIYTTPAEFEAADYGQTRLAPEGVTQ